MTEKYDKDEARGFGISNAAQRLRNYGWIARRSIKTLSGWFLRIGDFEHKYALSYHLYDNSEHVTWIRNRLGEMRGGNPNANIQPRLRELCDIVMLAPADTDFFAGYYGVLQAEVIKSIKADLKEFDRSANANEIRLLRRVLKDLEDQQAWFLSLGLDVENNEWAKEIKALIESMGGLHGELPHGEPYTITNYQPFVRPERIHFDSRITVGPLCSYEEREKMDAGQATIEQFKVFFNEFYAAALLASILYDAADSDYPWEMSADFSRHFWDEARHSEFGCIRLRELGCEPDRVNPVLFDESQGLPLLHRIAYLTRGLEAYFMPRKGKRVKDYEKVGDIRSQLFADQDWSDEINHVRYGSRWTDFLLDDDHRDLDDIVEEVKAHLSTVRGKPVSTIDAPF
ncbi:DUF455 family protein [Pelagicoccus sp. SDUM812002]|uniref:DUF455 family protein n=1 Tax=Pelagicoccus sp. SDUM812002 TaxID=3041266 RepID=UPI00280CFFFE|nr:DUF455 family protein [Pelagicoccus sp. SDUM812002]MDQ8187692.1 DUF455 family protein [Pelagicoccus sp. SDUM812002]